MNLSTHFSLAEATFSPKALELSIDNSAVTPKLLTAATHTASRMEIVRSLLHAFPIHVNSWIRCSELNTAIGGAHSSQHLKGEAVDFICPTFGTPLDICKALVASKQVLQFDQLILEHTWVHISFCAPDVQPRGEVLSLLQGGKYSTGLTTLYGVPYGT